MRILQDDVTEPAPAPVVKVTVVKAAPDAVDFWKRTDLKKAAATTANSFTVSIAIPSAEGKPYDWTCIATSSNPSPTTAKFRTSFKTGSVTTGTVIPIEDTGAFSMISSLMATLCVLLVAFFY